MNMCHLFLCIRLPSFEISTAGPMAQSGKTSIDHTCIRVSNQQNYLQIEKTLEVKLIDMHEMFEKNRSNFICLVAQTWHKQTNCVKNFRKKFYGSTFFLVAARACYIHKSSGMTKKCAVDYIVFPLATYLFKVVGIWMTGVR